MAHPGGPFFARKDDGAWTIPKGEAAPGEDLLTRAQIEFEEEVGFRPESVRDWIELGSIKQKGGKTVHAWAFEGDLPESFEPQIKFVRNGMAAALRQTQRYFQRLIRRVFFGGCCKAQNQAGTGAPS